MSYIKELVNKNDFNFKKRFGQNFLVDQNILHNIISYSNVDSETLVIEIGAGSGNLTTKLAEKAKYVLAYEIDYKLKPVLAERLNSYQNINLIFDDFLKRDISSDIKDYKYQHLYVIANLPYYITTPIITKLINDKINIDKMVIMVQKEVGERFNAKPGTKEYNSLTIFINYYFKVRKLFNVSKKAFIPQPKVDSVVIELSKKEEKYNVLDEALFFKVVKDSFTHKRKNLRNNLKDYDLDTITKVLSKYNLDLTVRAEHLTIEQFISIANEIKLHSWKFNFFIHIIKWVIVWLLKLVI